MSGYHLITWTISKLSGRSILLREIPKHSKLAASASGAYFSDAFEQQDTNLQGQSALKLYHSFLKNTPAWADALLTMRNKVCHALFGLKDVGVFSQVALHKPLEVYQPGEKLGIFTLVSIDENEVVFEDNDKHLLAQFSILKEPATNRLVLTAVVHVHNWIGRFYMLFVGPAHRVIAPMMLLSFPVLVKK